jgi:hypothetical protein
MIFGFLAARPKLSENKVNCPQDIGLACIIFANQNKRNVCGKTNFDFVLD